MFLHGFQQGALRLRRRAVDLVRQHDVRKQRSFDEGEFAFPRALGVLQDVRAGDVARHQVRRELDAVEVQGHHIGQRVNHRGLGQPGNTHQQRVTAGNDGDQQLFDDLFLTDDDLGDLVAQRLVFVTQFIDRGDIGFAGLGSVFRI